MAALHHPGSDIGDRVRRFFQTYLGQQAAEIIVTAGLHPHGMPQQALAQRCLSQCTVGLATLGGINAIQPHLDGRAFPFCTGIRPNPQGVAIAHMRHDALPGLFVPPFFDRYGQCQKRGQAESYN